MDFTLQELDIIIDALSEKRISICNREKHNEVWFLQNRFREKKKYILDGEAIEINKEKFIDKDLNDIIEKYQEAINIAIKIVRESIDKYLLNK